MDLRIPTERLTQVIGRHGHSALTHRQVARRLASLFPSRYQQLRREFTRLGGRAAQCERSALVDPRYEELVNELVDMDHAAVSSRIEYETHAMLFNARQSLGRGRRSNVR